MKIGYLHIGSSEHGICRYGMLLAAEAKSRHQLAVTEVSVTLTANRQLNQETLMRAASCLSSMDLVHIQYSISNNKGLWGKSWAQLTHLKLFRQHCRQPSLVVTLHDIYALPPNPRNLFKYLNYIISPISQRPPTLDRVLLQERNRSHLSIMLGTIRQYRWRVKKKASKIPEDLSLSWLLNQVDYVFVSSFEEGKRLNKSINYSFVKVIPHFVEKRLFKSTKAEAKKVLNLQEYRIITLLGFIHGRKGHQLLLETISSLPQNIKVIFAGGASSGQENFLDNLCTQAKSLGISDRLRITGYLSEHDLDLYLLATDLAICPFKSFSASGSLSTWISATRPILAYQLPQITEYNHMVPTSMYTFCPYTSEALSKAILKCLSLNIEEDNHSIVQLREKLLISETFDRHLTYYKEPIKRN